MQYVANSLIVQIIKPHNTQLIYIYLCARNYLKIDNYNWWLNFDPTGSIDKLYM